MRVFAAVVFSSAVILTPVLATAQATSDETAAAVTAPTATATNDNSANLDEVVCKNSPPPTGSRLGGGRECHTQREWNQRLIDSQRALIQQQKLGFAAREPKP